MSGEVHEAKLADDDLAGAGLGAGRLLQVGGGTSTLAEEMARAGWRNQVSIDCSQTVIGHAKQRWDAIQRAEMEAAREAATDRRSSLAKKGTSFVKSFKNFMHLDHARASRKS